ncbi:hypothetical protein DAERI_010195 [Deinococcus aerius]|uniref:Uncharacterized protein n=1 Tax=Deinococcus aerius TaxID=200253 RepID=A0A2I9CR91_9DEIO|nr:hypothetical protein [Deinococcus aerius]GBF04023.1 hypothetical protein DAERI_010195 [Deinococcus aerius]
MDNSDFNLGPLRLKVHGYQFQESDEYWDANWVIVTAEVDLPGQACVRVEGPFLMTTELARFRDEMQMLYDRLDAEAGLWTIEPELKLRLEGKGTGAITAEIEITPNQMTQEHRFYAELDQTYLPLAIQQLNSILNRFPMRGQPR